MSDHGAAASAAVKNSGSFMLRIPIQELAAHGVTFVVAEMPDPVIHELERNGLLDLMGKEHLFPGHAEMLAACDALPPADAPTGGVQPGGAPGKLTDTIK